MSECREIRRLLVVQPVNWSADERAQVDAHLITCADCAALNRVYAEQDRQIRGLPSARLTPSQRGQLLSKIQLERRRHTMYTKLSAIAGVVAAVVIIIGIGFGAQTLLPPNTTPVSPSESLEPEVKVTEEPLLEWTFGGEIRLVKGTDPHPFLGIPNPTDPTKPGSVVPPTTVQISLAWELLAQPTASWVAFVHLVDETGALVAQSDVPLDPPTEQCETGTRDPACRFFSEHEIQLPGDTGAHLCTIEIGIYNQDTGERALVTDKSGDQDALTLGQVNIVGREPAVTGMPRGYFEWPIIPHDDLALMFHDPRNPDHPGLDIAAEEGASVTAADGGAVAFAGWDEEQGYGYLVIVEHDDGWTSLYAHLSEILVEAGQTLQRGDLLGKAGSTGWSTGPHLHFELRHWNQPVDPLVYLPSAPDPQPTITGPSSSTTGLTIEEYPLAAADAVEPSFDLVALVPEKVLARRESWRQVIPRCVPGLYDCPPYVIGEHAYTVELIDVLHYNVREDGTLVYTISATETPPDPVMHIALLDWQGQWVLEFNNRVIINGTSFNEQHGYDRVFNWRVVHGELFYFFEQDGRVHVSYDGETLPQTYAEVAHNLCCEPAVCNVQTYADMVAFYARKEGTWFYVEMGVY
jgi:hypothetical protein